MGPMHFTPSISYQFEIDREVTNHITGTSSSPSLDHFLHPPHHPPPPAAAAMVGFVNDSGIYLVPSREANNVSSNNASNGSSTSGGIPGWLAMRTRNELMVFMR